MTGTEENILQTVKMLQINYTRPNIWISLSKFNFQNAAITHANVNKKRRNFSTIRVRWSSSIFLFYCRLADQYRIVLCSVCCCIYWGGSCSICIVSDAFCSSVLQWCYSIVPQGYTATSTRATVYNFRPQRRSAMTKSLIKDEINTRVDCAFAVG